MQHRFRALVLAGAALATLVGAACARPPTHDTVAPGPDAYARYRNARYAYQLDYPSAYDAGPVASNGDGRVLRASGTTLRVFGVQQQGRSLRALAMSEIADPSAVSEIQNSEGTVTLVQDDARATRTVKAIALTGERAALLVIEGAIEPPARRRHILASFKPVSTRAADTGETDADRRYHNPQLGFSIQRAQGARISRDGADSVSFTVLGPANEAASEITDGFTVTVIRDPRAAAQTLDAYGERVRADGMPPAERVRVGPHDALRYTSRSGLGDTVTHWLFVPASGGHYRVTASVSGPGRGYHRQIDAMLASLRFD